MIQTSYRPEWIKEDFVDFVLAKVNPLWTWKRVMARIDAIEPIADGMIKVTLSTNNKFIGHRAGQFVMVSVRIDGVMQQRAYSIVSSPDEDHIVLFAAIRLGRQLDPACGGVLRPPYDRSQCGRRRRSQKHPAVHVHPLARTAYGKDALQKRK